MILLRSVTLLLTVLIYLVYLDQLYFYLLYLCYLDYLSLLMIPIQVVFSLPLFALHKLDSLDLHWFSLVSAFGDSNDNDINLDDLFPDIQNQEQASLLHHPASLPQPPPPPPPPFDMVDFMHAAGSYDLKKVLTTDQCPNNSTARS